MFVRDVDLSTLNDKAMTLLCRERVGFVFQAFNLVPTLTARENIVLPLSLAGRKPGQDMVRHAHRGTGYRGPLLHQPSEMSGSFRH